MEKLILADGWIFKEQHGAHRQYIHPTKPGRVTIPFHKGKDLNRRTENSVRRQGGPLAKPESLFIHMYRRCKLCYQYIRLFFKEEDGYSVVSPDLNWLATQGDTLEEAMEMAADCLAGYLYTCLMEKDAIPEPSRMSDIDPAAVSKQTAPDETVGEAFVNMVSVDVTAYAKQHFEKSVRKTLTIPAWLNAADLEMDINFSQVLQEALIAKVQAR